MKVNEFVKEYGLECVRGIVNNSENHWAYDHILDEYKFDLESWNSASDSM